MAALEAEGCPVCQVSWPVAVGALWGGLYGNAKIVLGAPSALLASGEVVPL